MRIIFTLSFCLLFTVAFSQKSKEPEFVIRTSCTLRPVKEIPVHIVIKDVSDDAPVLGATVSVFRPFKGDSLHFAANDSGIVAVKFSGPDDPYTVSISAVGYKDTSFILNRSGKHTVLLRRLPVELKPVILNSFILIRCRKYYCCCGGTRIKKDSVAAIENTEKKSSFVNFKVFPNPSLRGTSAFIQFESLNQESGSVRIFSMNGQLVGVLPANTVKGKNQLQVNIETRWPAGTYIFQLCYANGSVAASGKVIIH